MPIAEPRLPALTHSHEHIKPKNVHMCLGAGFQMALHVFRHQSVKLSSIKASAAFNVSQTGENQRGAISNSLWTFTGCSMTAKARVTVPREL